MEQKNDVIIKNFTRMTIELGMKLIKILDEKMK